MKISAFVINMEIMSTQQDLCVIFLMCKTSWFYHPLTLSTPVVYICGIFSCRHVKGQYDGICIFCQGKLLHADISVICVLWSNVCIFAACLMQRFTVKLWIWVHYLKPTKSKLEYIKINCLGAKQLLLLENIILQAVDKWACWYL